ncbi:hypothetical protein J437_LFUL000685 [Ladona fulva]|uniref:Uncharacterized protein n=1 Tax=Ladona fulva TaxID=123851 RepID=A0A8K0NWZ9_LADFU|nr:hypothetical protein J437_LFUL000685 [Ladona fulva]
MCIESKETNVHIKELISTLNGLKAELLEKNKEIRLFDSFSIPCRFFGRLFRREGTMMASCPLPCRLLLLDLIGTKGVKNHVVLQELATKLLNSSLKKGLVPDGLKLAMVKPIPKSKGHCDPQEGLAFRHSKAKCQAVPVTPVHYGYSSVKKMPVFLKNFVSAHALCARRQATSVCCPTMDQPR